MTGSNTSGASVASLTFSPPSGSDKVPVEITDELVRRSIVTIEDLDSGNVVFSPTEPTDKTKVWWKTDPITGIPEGVAMVWSEDDNAWVPSTQDDAPYSPPTEQFFSFDAAAGASTKTASFADMGTANYFVDVEVSTFIAGIWQAAPANMNNFGWAITNKTNTSMSMSLFAVPTGGLHFSIRIRNET